MLANMIKPVVLFLWCLYWKTCDSQLRNNVCKIFGDVNSMDDSDNCWYNPDVYSTPEKIARRFGYAFQRHKVETEDGYYLTLFRIQDKFSDVKKPPIYIHHGTFSSAMGFMAEGNKSLAFYLARNGYDVWLGNHRGNDYSIGHSNLSTTDPKYWDFSFHEIGLYDVPAATEYITHETGNFSKITYIGHSLGTTLCFIYASLRSDHAQNHLKGFIALSAATSAKYLRSWYRLVTPRIDELVRGLIANNVTVLFPEPEKVSRVVMEFCTQLPKTCLSFLSYFSGNDDHEFSAEDIIVLLSYHPARTSLKIASHWLQITSAQKFQQYDYGPSENYKRYNSKTPPTYPLKNITIPVHMFYGLNDNLVNEKDTHWALTQLKTKEKAMIKIPEYGNVGYNHVNFVVSKNIETYLYKPLMRSIKKFEELN